MATRNGGISDQESQLGDGEQERTQTGWAVEARRRVGRSLMLHVLQLERRNMMDIITRLLNTFVLSFNVANKPKD